MLNDRYNYNKEVILNDTNITNSIIKLINDAYNTNLDDNGFKDKFFNKKNNLIFLLNFKVIC